MYIYILKGATRKLEPEVTPGPGRLQRGQAKEDTRRTRGYGPEESCRARGQHVEWVLRQTLPRFTRQLGWDVVQALEIGCSSVGKMLIHHVSTAVPQIETILKSDGLMLV